MVDGQRGEAWVSCDHGSSGREPTDRQPPTARHPPVTRQVVESAVTAVKHLRSLGCEDIEFSPEDAGRSDPVFLYRILGEVIAAGATTLNIPDTTGWNLPHEFGGLIAAIKANTPGIDSELLGRRNGVWGFLLGEREKRRAGRAFGCSSGGESRSTPNATQPHRPTPTFDPPPSLADAIISTHCQNDLGLSTANSLAGAMNGARQVGALITYWLVAVAATDTCGCSVGSCVRLEQAAAPSPAHCQPTNPIQSNPTNPIQSNPIQPPPDRVHHQRHRREGRQRVAGGGGDGHRAARVSGGAGGFRYYIPSVAWLPPPADPKSSLPRHQPTPTDPQPTTNRPTNTPPPSERQMSGLYTGIRPVHIYPTSKMVSDYSGMIVQPHKAIVGANAFAHESGIHQDGMLKSRWGGWCWVGGPGWCVRLMCVGDVK